MADVTVDPRIYGGDSMPEEALHAMSIGPDGSTSASTSNPTGGKVGTFADVNAPTLEAEGQASAAALTRPTSSMFDSAGAAASQWALADIYRWATAPDFEPDSSFNATQNLSKYGLSALTTDERDYLLDSSSFAEQEWKAENLKLAREAHVTMGDHTFISALTTAVDPTFLALDLVAPVASNLVGAGRLGAAAVGGAGAAAITFGASQARPMSTPEIFGNILMGMGGSALAYRHGRIVEADPEHPSLELQAAAKNIERPTQPGTDRRWVRAVDADGNPRVSSTGKPMYTLAEQELPVVGRTPEESVSLGNVVRESEAVAADMSKPSGKPIEGGRIAAEDITKYVAASSGTLAAVWKNLQEKAGAIISSTPVYLLDKSNWERLGMRLNAKHAGGTGARDAAGKPIDYTQANGIYDPATKTVYLNKAKANTGTAVHELTHAATLEKLRYGKAHPETEHGRMYRELDDLRKRAQQEMQAHGEGSDHSAYYTSNAEEFVAGLYSGDSAFLRRLAAMKDPKSGVGLLSKVVDAVRRILGWNVDQGSALARALQVTDDLLDSSITRPTKESIVPAASVVQRINKTSEKAGNTIAWNLHKTLAKWDKGVADLLVDDPVNKSHISVESQRQSILRGLEHIQAEAEPVVRKEMARRGAGTWFRIRHPKQAVQIYDKVNKEITREALNMGDAARTGTTYSSSAPALVQEAAKLYTSKLGERALKELQNAGVEGSALLKYRDGFFSRRWEAGKIENLITRMGAHGIDRKAAVGRLNAFVTDMIERGQPGIDHDIAQYIGQSLIDRAIRKGEFIDSSFHAHIGSDAAREVEDMLKQANVPANRIPRVMNVLTSHVDEAGKAGFLKRRVELDSQAQMRMPDGQMIDLTDMIDTDMNNIADRYIHGVAGQSALARKGIKNATDIAALRKRLIDGAPMRDKQEAARVFDQSMNFILGRPTGAAMSRGIRKLQAVNRMIGLGASGLWQLTEYSRMMAQYGLGKTLKYSMAEIPPFRKLMGMSPDDAGSLQNVLATQSSQDLRLRPYIKRLEDNYEWHHSDLAELLLQQGQQLVPYFNGMWYIHHHQAMVAANCIVDVLQKGARGDAKAIQALESYGMDAAQLQRHSKEILGSNIVENWSDAAWEAMRPAITKMMDDSVLKNRLGEVPAFAQFDPVGKFVFTFRSFVLGAHNKILASDLATHGLGGVSLVAMYQFPLMLLASQASNVLAGRGVESDSKKLIAQAISQAGVMGAFGDIIGAAMGTKSQFGSPGLIAIDKGFRLASDIGHGQAGQAVNDMLGVVGVVPGIRALGALIKQTDE